MISRDKTAQLAEKVRRSIFSGEFPLDRYLPPLRVLGDLHGASPETVRRGLKQLESEGLLRAQARHGFRVIRRNGTPYVSGPVAYVTEHRADLANAQPSQLVLQDALQRAAGARGSALLGTHAEGLHDREVADRLRAGRAWGVVLDTENTELVEAIRRAAVPTVMVNHWREDSVFDIVQQDNYRGGYLAVGYLLRAGCRSLAWIGPAGQYTPTRERYAGAVAALRAAGMPPPELVSETSDRRELRSAIGAMLDRDRRPDGLLAFTSVGAEVACDLAHEKRIEMGTDVRLVGWVVEECYKTEFAQRFEGRRPPPAIIWSARTCAEAVLDRLTRLGQGEAAAALRIAVPVSIREGAAASS